MSMEIDNISSLIAIGSGLTGFLYVVFSFVSTNRSEHLKIIQGLDSIVKDCYDTNKQNRIEIRENNAKFVQVLEKLIDNK